MAMADVKGSLDYWRNVFSSFKYNIFELIDNAILVATMDYPKEFKDRKIMIAEKLCTSQLSLSSECNRTDLQVLNNGGDEHPKEEKISSNCEDTEEWQIVEEVMRIKKVLCNHLDESDSVLYESLSRLQLIQFSVETLKETEIGKAVNALRKRNSGQIRKLVRVLIKGWRMLVDEWIKSTAAATRSIATDSVEKPNKSSATDSGALGCSPNRTPEQKPSGHFSAGAKRKQPEEVSHASKLEITKRKLHEGYQRAENTKKRRMIQNIELRDLPMAAPEKRRLKNLEAGMHSERRPNSEFCRRNLDPKSAAARERRKRITEKTLELGATTIIPGGSKINTACCRLHSNTSSFFKPKSASFSSWLPFLIAKEKVLQVLLASPAIQERPSAEGMCIVGKEMVHELAVEPQLLSRPLISRSMDQFIRSIIRMEGCN